MLVQTRRTIDGFLHGNHDQIGLLWSPVINITYCLGLKTYFDVTFVLLITTINYFR